MKKILVLALLIINVQTVFAALKVSPTVIELNANKAKGNYLTTSFNVRGDEGETIRFKVYPSYFEITEEGKMFENPELKSEHSLVNNARFIPNEFTLTNGEEQKVRVTISDLDKLPDGENRMVLFLEDVQAKEIVLPFEKKDVVTKLLVKTRVGIPVYVDKGKFVKCAVLNDLKINKKQNDLFFDLNLTSNGNSKVRYRGIGQIIRGKELVDEFSVYSKTIKNNGDLYVSQKIPLENIKENGEYKLRVILNYENEKGNTKNLIKETFFNVEKTNI